MSSIDDRIVDMQFNNASFEKNVGSSIKSLENLNKALELKDASKGLNNVGDATRSIDFSGIANGVQNISSKFNILGAVGFSIINKLTGALMGFAGDSVNAIIDPLIEGGKRRAQNIEQAKFMIKGLGKDWDKLYKDMDYAVAGTAFGIDAAAKAASQLSASGISAGRDMKTYLRGISGVAAMTGSSYEDIADIFITTAGNGRVMASELNRISQRGLNASKALADYFNAGRKGAKLTEKDIRKMASEGKISADDLAKAMDNAFGEQATKANELYAGSLSNVKAALSRLGEKFVTPVFEKQKNIFNQLRFVINGVNAALGPFIKLWGKVQKESGDVVVNLLKDAEKAVGILDGSPASVWGKQKAEYEKYVKAKEKYEADPKKNKKPKFTEELKAAKAAYDYREKLKKKEEEAEKKWEKAKAKAKKAGKEEPEMPSILKNRDARAQEDTPFNQSIVAITKALDNLYESGKLVLGAIGDAFKEAFPDDPAARSMILSIAEGFRNFTEAIKPGSEQLEKIKKAFSGFFTVVKLVWVIVSNVFKGIPGLIAVVSGAFKVFLAAIQPAIDFISQLATSFMKSFKEMSGGVDIIDSVNNALTWLRENGVAELLKMFDNATKYITDFWDNLFGGAGGGNNLFEGFDPFTGLLEKLKGFASIMSDFFKNAWEWAKGIFESLKGGVGVFSGGAGGFFKGLGDTLKNIGSKIPGILSELKAGFAEFFKGFDWTTLLSGLSSGGLIAMLVQAFKGFKNFFKIATQAADFVNLVKSGVVDAITAFNGALDGFTGTMGAMQKELKTKMIVNIAVAVALLAASFWLLSKVDVKGMDSAAAAITMILMEVMGALFLMTKIESDKGTVKMAALTGALILLGISLIAFAAAIKILSEVDPNQMAYGLATLSAGLIMMGTALAVLSGKGTDSKKMLAAAFAMNILAGALMTMAGAVAIFGLMPLPMLIQGGIALAALLVLLTLFTALPSENALKAGIAIGILAFALNSMVATIAILAYMPMDMLIKGGAALGIMILGLVIAVNLMRGATGSATSMVAIALALVILLIPIKKFSEMDPKALEQGITATLIMVLGLVVAANMMKQAMPGAGAMIVMAIAIAILAAAVWVLAQIPADQLFVAVMAIAVALGVLLLAALGAQAVAPGLFILAGAILAMGLAVLAAGAGMLLFAIGLGMVGGAAYLAVPGLMALGNAAVQMVPQLLPMVGLALAIGALAIAVLGLGLGFITLGLGLIAVGAGLAILAAVGGMGAIAVMAVWKALEPLIWSIPQMGLLGGAFLVLGGGLIALGVGLALTAVGLIAIALGLVAIVGMGFATAATIDALRESLERFVPMTAQITPLADSINQFANAAMNLNTALFGISTALATTQTGFEIFATSAKTLETSFTTIPNAIAVTTSAASVQLSILVTVFIAAAGVLGVTVRSLGEAVQNGSGTLRSAMTKMVSDVASFAAKLTGTTPMITLAVTVMIATISATIKTGFSGLGTSVGNSAENVGKNVVSGFLRGVKDPHNSIGAAARAMAQKFIKAMKDEFEIKSPSKVMEELGQYVKEGFNKGLTGFEDAPVHRVVATVNEMRDKLTDAMADIDSDIEEITGRVTKLDKKKKKSKKDKADLRKARQELSDAQLAKKNSEEAIKLLDGALRGQQEALIVVSDKYDIVVENLKNATNALSDAEKEMADAQKSYTEQFSKLPDFAEDGDLVNTYVTNIEDQIEATKKFAKDLAYLRNMGLDDTTYSKLLEKGLDAQPFIDALIKSGQQGVDEVNKLDKQLGEAASALGTIAAKEMHKAGIDMARGLVEELTKQEGALRAQMESLANAMVSAIRKQLDMHSPSRVFATIGGYTVLGLMEGMQKYVPALENASKDIGDTAVDGLRNAINEIGEQVYGEMDMSPVIKPVLDLSDVTSSAKQLGNVFGSRSINIGSTYADASNIALAARQRELLTNEQNASVIGSGDSVVFNQYNNSPKALPNSYIYRQTRNQLSVIKKGLTK